MSDPLEATYNRQAQSAAFSFDFGSGLRFHLDERTVARRPYDYEFRLPLTGNNPPTDLEQILLRADTPHGPVEEAFAVQPNLFWQRGWDGTDASGQHHFGSIEIPVSIGWQRGRKGPLPKRTQWWDKPLIRAGWDARALPFGGLLPLGLWHFEPLARVLWGAGGERLEDVEIYTGHDREALGLTWVTAWPDDLIVLTDRQALVFNNSGQLQLSLDRVTGEDLFQVRYNEQGVICGWTTFDGANFEVETNETNTTVTAPNGYRVTFYLDEQRRLATATTTNQATFTASFNPLGLVETITDPVGLGVTVSHDDIGRATTLSWSSGQREDFVSINEAGRKTTLVLSAGGREASETHASLPGDTAETRSRCCGSATETITLRSPGRTVVTKTDGTRVDRVENTVTTKEGEVRTERITLRTPHGRTSVMTRTRTVAANGDVEEVVERNGQRWVRSINHDSTTMVETHPSGLSTRVDYATPNLRRWYRPDVGLVETEFVNGHAVRTTHGHSISTAEYDEAGWLKTTADDGIVRQFTYNPAGHITAEYTGTGWLQFERDLAGRIVASTTPRGDTTQITLDTDGLVRTMDRPTDAGTITEHFTYDADRYLVERQVEGEEAVVITRAISGDVQKMAAGANTIEFGFDERSGRIVSTTTESGDAMWRTYDGHLLLAQESSGSVNGRVEYQYDSHHQVSGTIVLGMLLPIERDVDGKVVVRGPVRFVRSADTGQVTSTLVGSLATSYVYDERGQLISHATYLADQLIFAEAISRDETGRIIQVEESTTQAAITTTYGYDQGRRLVSVVHGGSALATLTYDSNDNIVDYGRPTVPNTVEVGTGDRIRAVDGEPNITYTPSGRVTNLAGRVFHYDGFGRVTRVSGGEGQIIDHLRDGNHQLIQTAVNGEVTFQFLRKPGGIAAVIKPDGTTWRVVTDEGGHAPAALVSETQVLRVLCDHRGNVRLVVEANTGEVLQAISYDPFGSITTDSNPGFQPFGYTGAVHDSIAGLVHLGARELDVVSSRFLQPDPLELAGGQANLYAYAANDPVNRHDPTGLQSSGQGPVSVCKVKISSAGSPTLTSIDHSYLKWGDTRRGMGKLGVPNFLGSDLTHWEDEGAAEYMELNEECQEVEGVDIACLENYTMPGKGTGRYGPANVCWDVVFEALDYCADNFWMWKDPTDPSWPMTKTWEIATKPRRGLYLIGKKVADLWVRLTE